MISVPLVSVLREGLIENFNFQLEYLNPQAPDIELRGISFNDDLIEQLHIAKKAAKVFYCDHIFGLWQLIHWRIPR